MASSCGASTGEEAQQRPPPWPDALSAGSASTQTTSSTCTRSLNGSRARCENSAGLRSGTRPLTKSARCASPGTCGAATPGGRGRGVSAGRFRRRTSRSRLPAPSRSRAWRRLGFRRRPRPSARPSGGAGSMTYSARWNGRLPHSGARAGVGCSGTRANGWRGGRRLSSVASRRERFRSAGL